MIRLVLADDQLLFIRSLKVVLESGTGDIQVVGSARNGKEAVEVVRNEVPDIVLMDVRMPEMDGVEAARLIHAEFPQVKIMMLTTFDDDEYVHQALHHGAIGYLLKDIPPEELVSSVRALSQGAVQLSPSVASKLVNRVYERQHPSPETARLDELNKREKEVLKLLTQGLDNREIAEQLYIAEQTVKNYVSAIYTKLGVRDRMQAMQVGLKADLE